MHSATDRLFDISTVWLDIRLRQAGIETGLISYQPDILPLRHVEKQKGTEF